MSPTHLRRRGLAVALATATLAGGSATSATAAPRAEKSPVPRPDFTLTLLHANDQESALLPITSEDGQVFAGAARFTQLLQREERRFARRDPGPGQATRRGVLTVSAGDHFLPGPTLAASDDSGRPHYDARAFSLADWDVAILGNHDFDRGPDYLGAWFDDVTSDTPFVAGNLGFGQEPELLAEVRDGTIVTSSVQHVEGERIGIIGLT
ncbi:MAG: bifunctional metallophosphatase/5'-nucleotidase, partial [Actinomycetes bacterium]